LKATLFDAVVWSAVVVEAACGDGRSISVASSDSKTEISLVSSSNDLSAALSAIRGTSIISRQAGPGSRFPASASLAFSW
jgi:hypothetical protein